MSRQTVPNIFNVVCQVICHKNANTNISRQCKGLRPAYMKPTILSRPPMAVPESMPFLWASVKWPS